MTLAIILCFLWWSGTLIFAAWWSERRYQDGYQDGYSDAEAFAKIDSILRQHEWKGNADVQAAFERIFFGGEP